GERPMSERSEFGPRLREGDNVPRRPRSAGDRTGAAWPARVRRKRFDPRLPALALMAGFAAASQPRGDCCQDKGQPRDGAKAVAVALRKNATSANDNVKGFRPLRVRVPFAGPRGTMSPSPDASRRGCAAPVPCAPRRGWHGAQTRCAQTWATLRPPPAAVLGSLYGQNVRSARKKQH